MIIYTDAAEQRKIVNSYGKIVKTGAFQYALTDEKGETLDIGWNSKIKWQIEAETYGVLKAVDYLIQRNIKSATIINDNTVVLGGIEKGFVKSKSSTKTNKYIRIINKLIKENGLVIDFQWVKSESNLADKASRQIQQ